MKIKKVEIQAFRAYDKAEDGTFDFKISEDGEYADFISLYAPNGFGKTSFYDAVEYGYTKNINRFLRNDKLNSASAKSEKNINNKEPQYILRNKYSDTNLKGYVKIHINNGEPICRELNINTKKGSSDYNFNENDTDKKWGFFKRVILSQEWLSHFLSQDTPEIRYDTFISNFGDQKLADYYNQITNLISINEKEITKIKNELKGIQLTLNFDGDKNVLTKVNERIDILNKKGKVFNLLYNNTSQNDILVLENSITERLSFLNSEIKKQQEHISNLDKLIVGDETFVGYNKFMEDYYTIKKLIEKQKELRLILANFGIFKTKKTELISFQNSSTKLADEKKQRVDILSLFPKYEEIKKDIEKKNLRIDELKVSQKESIEEQSKHNIRIPQLEFNIVTKKEEANIINSNIIKLQVIERDIKNTETQIKELNNKKTTANEKIDELSKNKIIIDNIYKELEISLKEINTGNFPSELDKIFQKYSEQIQKHDELQKIIEEEKNKLKSIEFEIKEYSIFSKEIESFILNGQSIINKSQTTCCPLCNQDYKSYTDLAERVANNKLISKKSNELLIRKKEIDETINSITSAIINNTKTLETLITKDKENSALKIKEIKKDLQQFTQEVSEIQNFENFEKKKLNDLKNTILNKTTEEYQNWGVIELKKLNNEISEQQAELTKTKEKLKKLGEDYQKEITEEKIIRNEVETLKDAPLFPEIEIFISKNYPNLKIESKTIKDDLPRLEKKIEACLGDIENIKCTIIKLEDDLKSYDEESTKNELEELQSKIDKLNQVILMYKIAIKKYAGFENITEVEEEFKSSINKLKEIYQLKITEYDNEVTDVKLLSELKGNVLPYLTFEKNKKKQSDLKTSKELKEKVDKVLNEEKNKVSTHLENQIKSFFYVDLINELYKRIDPHPDYKKVKFSPVFSGKKPRLDVFVYKNDGSFITPSLYFSQAQLNILSLSIFLAKALNIKDDDGKSIDCIFIDDPIQSMDSINILSTIDLLRSIVVNQKKQIILSTHDENFHNLLKKKMPTNLFKSKFMELETFGKVKADL